jgi:hypothetical protein
MKTKHKLTDLLIEESVDQLICACFSEELFMLLSQHPETMKTKHRLTDLLIEESVNQLICACFSEEIVMKPARGGAYEASFNLPFASDAVGHQRRDTGANADGQRFPLDG